MFSHTSVLLQATVNALVDSDFRNKSARTHQDLPPQNKSGVFVDGTFGRGGHSQYLLKHLAPEARLIVIDKDPEAIEVALKLQAQDARVDVVHDGFANLDQILQARGLEKIQGVMMDLGVSSPQLDDASRGFSFMRDGPLDMRMDTTQGMTAQEWLATASVDEMKGVIKDYGEERNAFKIAKAIEGRRQSAPLRRTHELAQLVASVVRSREKGQHPATRTFQAIRIHLNQELKELSRGLETVLSCLATHGRMAVISFHSLEDRIVKQAIAKASKIDEQIARLPLKESELPQPEMLNLGKVKALAQEVELNVRSRSAVLRVAERTEVVSK